jgi:hypothetical protein
MCVKTNNVIIGIWGQKSRVIFGNIGMVVEIALIFLHVRFFIILLRRGGLICPPEKL